MSYLRTHPGEAGALLQDLLISVTNFFRDRESFEALELLVPELFRDKSQSDTVRVWVPACATGEEAYSIAMRLSEHARTLEAPPALQIFATDLDDDVLMEARNGVFPDAISTDVSPERLRRFFVKEHRGQGRAPVPHLESAASPADWGRNRTTPLFWLLCQGSMASRTIRRVS